MNRRKFLTGVSVLASGAAAGCSPSGMFSSAIDRTTTGSIGTGLRPQIGVDAGVTNSEAMYGEISDGGYVIPAVPYKEMEYRFRRQRLPNDIGIPAKTVLIDTQQKYAYYALTTNEVIRYGVGIGKAGFEWAGTAVVGYKKQWPIWTPPREMIDRKPELAKYSGGMPAGPQNPLGARSLYLYQNGRDTLYRLHGSPEWDSIGKAMSSGCIRFLNQDIVDLYNRVETGSQVIVR
jgi:lipoprotein-anchoring transpeptidase ErfK/SrfK